MHRVAAQPQAQGLPVDGDHHLHGHQGVGQQRARQGARSQRLALQHQGGVKTAGAAVVACRVGIGRIQHLHMHAQLRVRHAETPVVLVLHAHEGRDVEALVETPGMHVAMGTRLRHRQHVGVALLPGRVGDLGNDPAQAVVTIEAVVEADRIEHMAEVAQMREQADRTVRALAGVGLHAIAHCFIQWNSWVAEIIAATELRQVGAPYRPQPTLRKHPIQFGQIQIHQKQLVAEIQRFWRKPAVPHPTGIDRAAQRGRHAAGATALGRGQRHRIGAGFAQQLHHHGTPRPCATSTPLRRPSSWKPKPHAAPANQVCWTPWISALRVCAASAAAFCTGWR